MKNNFHLDKAIMAFKSKRLEESKNSYENALSLAYSKEAWLGLAITKLHLLSEDQTEVDVHYALDKTMELYPKSKNEVINELIENSKYLIHKYAKLAVQLGFEAKKQEDAKNMAAVASVASAVMGGLSSTSKWSNRFSLATGAGVGYALKKWGDEENAKVVQEGVIELIKQIIQIAADFSFKHKLHNSEIFKNYVKENDPNVIEKDILNDAESFEENQPDNLEQIKYSCKCGKISGSVNPGVMIELDEDKCSSCNTYVHFPDEPDELDATKPMQ